MQLIRLSSLAGFYQTLYCTILQITLHGNHFEIATKELCNCDIKNTQNMKSYNENKTVSGASSEGCAKDNRCGGGVCGRSRVGTSTSDRGLTVYILMMASLLFIALVSVKGVTSFAVDIPSADEVSLNHQRIIHVH